MQLFKAIAAFLDASSMTHSRPLSDDKLCSYQSVVCFVVVACFRCDAFQSGGNQDLTDLILIKRSAADSAPYRRRNLSFATSKREILNAGRVQLKTIQTEIIKIAPWNTMPLPLRSRRPALSLATILHIYKRVGKSGVSCGNMSKISRDLNLEQSGWLIRCLLKFWRRHFSPGHCNGTAVTRFVWCRTRGIDCGRGAEIELSGRWRKHANEQREGGSYCGAFPLDFLKMWRFRQRK